ncbi:hypothetical protein AB0I82_09255 [Streptomyces sp. NPDC050315]|uniref:hypothetical protein n=1 Tax=Streptomyces sp. NPDC050315 TaxID=3155039 RepID=UPI00341890AC
MKHPTDRAVLRQSNAWRSDASGDVAWRHMGTRRVWTVALLVRLLGIPLGLAYAGAVFVAVHVIWVWLTPFLVLGSLVALGYGVYLQVGLVKRMLRLRRILRAYPWQVYEGGLPYSFGQRYSAHGERPWLAVPDPENPKSSVTVHLDVNRRTRWWAERMSPQAGPAAKAEIGTMWVVGDPRFRAVLAVPGKRGPRRMVELPAGGSRSEHFSDASPEALIRAVKAGVRLPELALPAMTRTPVVPAPAPPLGPAWSFPATRRSMWLMLLRAAVVPVLALIPFFWYLGGLITHGTNGVLSGKSLAFLLGAIVVAFLRFRSRFALYRKLRSKATPWRKMDVEIRHRGRALVLVTGNEALRTQLALRRPPAGRAQVWYVGDIYGEGMVSLRADGAVMPVRCTEHGRPTSQPKDARKGERPRTRRWGPVG